MGMVSSVENINNQIMKPIDYFCDKTIEDEEPLKQIQQIAIQMNAELFSKRLIQDQNRLFPEESTGINKWKKNVKIELTSDIIASEQKISSKGILKSPNSQPQGSKSDKKVTFKKAQIKENNFFRSNNQKKKHKVTLRDLEQMF